MKLYLRRTLVRLDRFELFAANINPLIFWQRLKHYSLQFSIDLNVQECDARGDAICCLARYKMLLQKQRSRNSAKCFYQHQPIDYRKIIDNGLTAMHAPCNNY